jgi:S-adenosylmethionine synthetase
MSYYFTSESVSEGHPDKIADQISDAIIDEYLAQDPSSKVACEVLVTTGQVIIAGEVKSKASVDVQKIARGVINRIGYTKGEYMFSGDSCGILNAIHEQSPDINQGVEKEDPTKQGAGDQGMMFGYASAETSNYMPLALDLSHKILEELAEIRREQEGKGTWVGPPLSMSYLRPDAKSQVTLEYSDDNVPVRIDTIVVSTQHDDFSHHYGDRNEERMLEVIKNHMVTVLIPRIIKKYPQYAHLFNDSVKYHINPTGKFVIGGPHGDTGLTGRKIIVDTYGGKGAHGGGAFSGKDPSKVDRSAAYAARHIAKNLVASGLCREVLVQVSYAIGVAEPTSINVNTYGTSTLQMTDGEISKKVEEIFDMTPYAIEKRLKLRNPIYSETASYGHMGRTPEKKTKIFFKGNQAIAKEVELFTWEKLDYVEKVKKAFKIK